MDNSKETIMKYVFLISALMSIVALVTIIYFIFANGLPIMFEYGITDFLFGNEWRPSNNPPLFGLFPMIVGSIYATLGAAVLGVPVGVLTAIYMAHFCPDWLYKFLKPAVKLMASIPSIVMGFFAMRLIVPAIRENLGGTGYSLLAAIIILSIMILPTIIELSESSIRSVPKTFYSASVGLGATHERTVMSVIVPAAKSGVLSSVVLGIGRAIGETMAVVMVAGNQPVIPGGLLDGMRTLTINIVLEMGYATGAHREALIATAVVLFVFIFIINGSFLILKNRGEGY